VLGPQVPTPTLSGLIFGTPGGLLVVQVDEGDIQLRARGREAWRRVPADDPCHFLLRIHRGSDSETAWSSW